jgi:signal transduction histidine kinase
MPTQHKPHSLLGGRLQRKLFLMMVFIGVVPIAASGFLALYSVTLSQRLNVASVQESIIVQKTDEIESFVTEIERSIFQLVTGFSQVSDIAMADQHFLLKGMLQEEPALEEVGFIGLGGRETARYTRAYARVVREDELRNLVRLEKFVVAKGGEAYRGPVYMTLEGPMMTLAAPVKNKNGVVISVLSGELNLTRAKDIVERSRVGNTGYVYLTDAKGFLIAKSGLPAPPTVVNLSGVQAVREVLFEKQPEKVYQERYTSPFGEKVVAAASRVPGLGLVLVSEWPLADADAVLNLLRNQILGFSLAVLFVTLLLSIFLAHRIVDPIKTLEEGTRDVAQGRFDREVSIRTSDEIEELGAAFNKMTAGLKELQQLKDEFVFIAAHELKTPVAAIKGYLSLVLEGMAGPVGDKVKEFIDKVMNANARLIRLVEDLLEVARSEAGRLTIEVAPVAIAEPVRQVIDELKSLADEKSIKVTYEPPPSLPQVRADAGRVKEVMVNLLGNAIKYTVGSGTVTVSHELRGNGLVTHITDTGVGISKEAQAKLFQKFYRVPNVKTKDVTGTGLGLFIVKQIIEKMEGSISVQSEEGKGSTFSFFLPLA